MSGYLAEVHNESIVVSDLSPIGNAAFYDSDASRIQQGSCSVGCATIPVHK